MVVDGIIRVGAERPRHAQTFETVCSPYDGGHCAAVERFGQRVPRNTRLNNQEQCQLDLNRLRLVDSSIKFRGQILRECKHPF